MDVNEANSPGRPRNQHSRAAILNATLRVLEQRGYAGLSLELVAKQATVGKTTIYRWWPSRAALAVDAFFADTLDELTLPTTADPAADFRQQIHELARLLRSHRGAILAALLAGGRTDPELQQALRTRWIDPRRKWGRARIALALKLGQCTPALDPEAALSLLYSPIYSGLLFGRGAPTAAQLDPILDLSLAAIFR